jgi:hypothetical protein
VSNLVALLRWNLFTYRSMWEWSDQPSETPPEGADQLPLHFPNAVGMIGLLVCLDRIRSFPQCFITHATSSKCSC